MINIIIDEYNEALCIEGEEPYSLNLLCNPSATVSILEVILNKVYYSGERICLEHRDKAGFYHEIDRWPRMS